MKKNITFIFIFIFNFNFVANGISLNEFISKYQSQIEKSGLSSEQLKNILKDKDPDNIEETIWKYILTKIHFIEPNKKNILINALMQFDSTNTTTLGLTHLIDGLNEIAADKLSNFVTSFSPLSSMLKPAENNDNVTGYELREVINTLRSVDSDNLGSISSEIVRIDKKVAPNDLQDLIKSFKKLDQAKRSKLAINLRDVLPYNPFDSASRMLNFYEQIEDAMYGTFTMMVRNASLEQWFKDSPNQRKEEIFSAFIETLEKNLAGRFSAVKDFCYSFDNCFYAFSSVLEESTKFPGENYHKIFDLLKTLYKEKKPRLPSLLVFYMGNIWKESRFEESQFDSFIEIVNLYGTALPLFKEDADNNQLDLLKMLEKGLTTDNLDFHKKAIQHYKQIKEDFKNLNNADDTPYDLSLFMSLGAYSDASWENLSLGAKKFVETFNNDTHPISFLDLIKIFENKNLSKIKDWDPFLNHLGEIESRLEDVQGDHLCLFLNKMSSFNHESWEKLQETAQGLLNQNKKHQPSSLSTIVNSLVLLGADHWDQLIRTFDQYESLKQANIVDEILSSSIDGHLSRIQNMEEKFSYINTILSRRVENPETPINLLIEEVVPDVDPEGPAFEVHNAVKNKITYNNEKIDPREAVKKIIGELIGDSNPTNDFKNEMIKLFDTPEEKKKIKAVLDQGFHFGIEEEEIKFIKVVWTYIKSLKEETQKSWINFSVTESLTAHDLANNEDEYANLSCAKGVRERFTITGYIDQEIDPRLRGISSFTRLASCDGLDLLKEAFVQMNKETAEEIHKTEQTPKEETVLGWLKSSFQEYFKSFGEDGNMRLGADFLELEKTQKAMKEYVSYYTNSYYDGFEDLKKIAARKLPSKTSPSSESEEEKNLDPTT